MIVDLIIRFINLPLIITYFDSIFAFVIRKYIKDFSLSIDYLQENIILDSFSPRVLAWFSQHGRHDLPWQQHKADTPDPYQVWLSEVMLQQTQVATVIPYFQRFIQRFPTVKELANADWDIVAEHWAGLGYYARARNLHKGAKQLVRIIEETGNFPQTVSDWEEIAGVGHSTAGAIVAMGIRQFGVICDGNVKRVLTRWAGIDGDITKTATNKQLWQLAERLTPPQNSGEYAQAMMDMGATLCTKSKPACLICPIQTDCVAHSQGRETSYPVKTKKLPNPSKYSYALKIYNPAGKMLWLQRPNDGIWGGLYCLPLQFLQKIFPYQHSHQDILTTYQDNDIFKAEYSLAEQIIYHFLTEQSILKSTFDLSQLATFSKNNSIKHTLTHFHWWLQPLKLHLTTTQADVLSQQLMTTTQNFIWIKDTDIQSIAIPKAMQKLLMLP